MEDKHPILTKIVCAAIGLCLLYQCVDLMVHHFVLGLIQSVIVIALIGLAFLFYIALGPGLESASRNKFPYDYLRRIAWVEDIYIYLGYRRVEFVNPGSEQPGIVMEKDGARCWIFLNAPLSGGARSIMILDSNGSSLTVPATQQEDSVRKITAFEDGSHPVHTA